MDRANKWLPNMGRVADDLPQYVELCDPTIPAALAFCKAEALQNAKPYAVSSPSGLRSGGVVGRFA